MTQAELASLLDIEPMTLSRHLDRMEAVGLVERHACPNDRRARRVVVTDKARALMEPMRERALVLYEEAQAGLSPEQRAALVAGLATVIANLSADDAEEEPAPRRRSQTMTAEPKPTPRLVTGEVPAPQPVRKRGRRKLLIVALPLALALGGGYVWMTGGRYIETEDAYVQQNRVNVVPQVSGQIAAVEVGENEIVAAGQTLFRLDDATYRNIGSSVGISVVATQLAHNTAVARSDLASKLTPFNPNLDPLLATATDPTTVLAQLSAQVQAQAAMIGYIDDFRLMMFVSLASIPLVLLLRRSRASRRRPPRASDGVARGGRLDAVDGPG